MSSIVKLPFICAITVALLFAIAAAQLRAIAPTNGPRRVDTRGRYTPYNSDPYYNNRYFKNREYYNRQYYDDLLKKYNPEVAAPQARIIAQNVESNHDGTYTYSYETENGIQAEERGVAVKVGTEEQKEVVEGSYSFVTPDGMRVIVKYTADENGYHPTITYDGTNADRFARLQQPADIIITRQN
ncbi:endocuticle structural glycoprotein ABD-4 [Anastrepha ludens]|uniref:endocuticle structural glycoprotein ABD-4 n=1 Tax=Anastrepha ludens TaxID=28586 RepID=UPI0023AF4EB9|nr:endocuticle structural glycoprotein ABD-4 [Anastrepha ludens]